jgi:hypothetical protein
MDVQIIIDVQILLNITVSLSLYTHHSTLNISLDTKKLVSACHSYHTTLVVSRSMCTYKHQINQLSFITSITRSIGVGIFLK